MDELNDLLQGVLVGPGGSATVAAPRARPRARHVHPAAIAVVVDVWLLLALLWGSFLSLGTLDPAVALFGLLTFAMLAAPHEAGPLNPSVLDDAAGVCRRVLIAYGVAAGATTAAGLGNHEALLFTALPAPLVLLAGRAASYAAARRLAGARERARVLVVGAGEIAARAIASVAEHPHYGLEVVGAVDDDPRFDEERLGAPLLGRQDDVPALVRDLGVDVVLVAFGSGDQASMVSTMRAALGAGATVWVVPRLFELGMVHATADHLWGLPVMRLRAPARQRPAWLLKRALDFAGAAAGLVLVAPLLVVAALATLIDSGRPVLFRQRRVGLDGRPFDILKFRTMADVPEGVQATEWDAQQRVTRVGRILRASGIDELPQLINVLKGEMSLVGPRPERPYFVERFRAAYPHYDARHRLPAGVTGWAQIHGLRGDTSIEERAAFDNHYIENWSLGQDLKILIRTVPTVLKQSGR